MSKIKLLRADLQAFDGGEGAAAPAAADMGSSAAPAQPQTSSNAPDAQAQAGGGLPENAPQGNNPPAKPTFDELVKGEYKAEYDSRVRDAVTRRMKTADAELSGLRPIMALLQQRYGIEDGAGAAAAVRQALEQDDAYWQSAADAAGMTAEQYRRMVTAEAQTREYKALLEQQQTEQRKIEVLQLLNGQAEQVKAKYPGFDVNTELQSNPQFGALIHNGIDMLTAYQVCHQQEILAAEAQRAEGVTMEKVRANQNRPAENGTGSGQAARPVSDPSKWTKADIRDIERRVMRGEKIYL